VNSRSKVQEILYVEDDPAAVYMFHEAIKELGFNVRVTAATNGKEAELMIAANGAILPDLIAINLKVHSGDSFGLLEAIRRSPRTAHLKTVVLAPPLSAEDEKRAVNLGVQEFFRKPFDLTIFTLIVGRICAIAGT
jgi:CheY-like chemotaxis protein